MAARRRFLCSDKSEVTRIGIVLSDLRARADAQAGELAKAYDQARLAGLACKVSCNALTKPNG